MTSAQTFGSWLRQLRAERDLTQEALAEAVGCAAETIRSFENGRRRPSVAMARRIAAILQLPVDDGEHFVSAARASQPVSSPESTTAHQPSSDRPSAPTRTLLATKLFAPPPPPHNLPRTHLLDRLAHSAARLTLVVAPPGFGKSTLLAGWLTQAQRAERPAPGELADGTVPLRAIWLSLDEQDDDPIQVLAYLVAALRQAAPGQADHANALLAAGQSSPQAVVAALINDLHADPAPLVIVLDDYHAIGNPAVHDLIVTLVERAPAALRLMIAARSDPPLPLARWRVRGLLRELRVADLRFTPDEAASLLVERLRLPLSSAQVAALEARTEGWPAGLQLAGLSLQGRDDAAAFIDAFSGSHRFVLDYLASETLARQPTHLRSFLLQTAVLRRLSAPLCDAVLGLAATPGDATGYSGLLLQELEQRNLFLIALDDQRRWWRYHHLFGDVLQAQLRVGVSAADVAALHLRAAHWYAEAGETDEAFHHARLAGDAELAAAVLERAAPGLLRQGALATLLQRLRALAVGVLAARPALAAYGIWALVEAGATDEAERLAQAAGAEQGPDADAVAQGYLRGGRAEIALVRQDYVGCAAYAREALALLGAYDPFFRYELLITLAGACESANELAAALDAARAAGALGRATGQPTFAADVLVSNVLSVQGRGAEAEAAVVAGLVEHADASGAVLPHAAALLVLLARLRLDRGLVAEAWALVAQARQLAEEHGFVYSVLYACSMQLYIGRCTADIDATAEAVRHMRSRAELLGAPFWQRMADGAEAELALLRGETTLAVAWAERAFAELQATPALPNREREYTLSCIAVLVGAGRGPELLPLVAAFGQQQRAAGRHRTALLLTLYEALCLHQAGRRAEAEVLLAAALREVVAQGAPSLVSTLPPLVFDLLPAVSAAAPNLVEALMNARGKVVRGAPGAAPDQRTASASADPRPILPEPLSEREREVLLLLSTGRSNQAIADELFLAVGTVKRHLNNIFGKLGVATRTEAVAQAHALGLLAAE
jgi:LuxR family transcriptional regulator, maltose regulon positive regulatory protein